MELMEEGNKKPKAPAQFVRMPDGSIKVMPNNQPKEQIDKKPKKAKRFFGLPKTNPLKPKVKQKAFKSTESFDNQQTKEIKISLTVPDINISKAKELIKKLPKPTRKQLYIGAPILIVLIGVGIFIMNRPEKTHTPATKVLGQKVVQKPDFKWVLPLGSVDKIAGGQVNYDPQKKVVLYTDIIDGTTVGVTQQALPATFKDNVKEKMAEYAKKINCTTQIEVEDVMAYAGLSTKGPQTVVFAKRGLLISIVADKEISPQSWGTYIASLK